MSNTRCAACSDLTIDRLVGLAHEEHSKSDLVPQQACYVLHGSVEALESSADAGCDFCSLLVTTLQGYEDENDWIARLWLGRECESEYSLFQSAKELPCSEIKICITSGDCGYKDELTNISVLDRILVQIGCNPISRVIETDEDYDKEIPEFPVIRFKLECSRDNPVFFDRFRIGQYDTEGNLDSHGNFNIARAWLRNCQEKHPHCPLNASSKLPTRVINVGAKDDWSDLCIIHTNGTSAEYVALSHCWGGPISTLLTTDTLMGFQDLLPFSELPANFQDAIIITRRLGLRFLWIDSLCIIQDSREDWAQESKKMGTIYRDSTVTISALASMGSQHGILSRKPKTRPTPSVVATLRVQESGKNVTVSREDFNEESLSLLDTQGPLARRGWCLQESILSPKQLYYGRDQIYWHCPAGYEAADGSSIGMRMPEHPLPYLSNLIFQDMLQSRLSERCDVLRLLEDYYDLVGMYSHRVLTYATDKLPAFSGIAGRLHDTIGGTYLAGIWSSDIINGLLWEREMRSCRHVMPFRAPTWSWTVTDDPVLFNNKSRDLMQGMSSSSLVLISHQVKPCDASNPFGELLSASITVRGLTLPVIRSRQQIGDASKEYYRASTSWDEPPPTSSQDETNPGLALIMLLVENDEGLYLLTLESHDISRRHEDFNLDTNEYAPEDYIALLVYVAKHDKTELETPDPAQGLILKPAKSDEADEDTHYERVGTFRFRQLGGLRLEEWRERTVILL